MLKPTIPPPIIIDVSQDTELHRVKTLDDVDEYESILGWKASLFELVRHEEFVRALNRQCKQKNTVAAESGCREHVEAVYAAITNWYQVLLFQEVLQNNLVSSMNGLSMRLSVSSKYNPSTDHALYTGHPFNEEVHGRMARKAKQLLHYERNARR